LRWWHDPELLARVVDDTDFADADTFVDAEPVVTTTGAGAIECDS
jgi:hypothetical protein